jgi:hypothetical protein
MAEHEPLLNNPPTQDAAIHVRDYTAFIRWAKWSALGAFITAMIVVMLIS